MSADYYRDEALSGRTPVEVVVETDEVLAFRPHASILAGPYRGHSEEARSISYRPRRDGRGTSAQGPSGGPPSRRQRRARIRSLSGPNPIFGKYQDSKHLHFPREHRRSHCNRTGAASNNPVQPTRAAEPFGETGAARCGPRG